MDKEINPWWIIAADDVIRDTENLIEQVNSTNLSQFEVDQLYELSLSLLTKVKQIEERIEIPFPYKNELIEARIKLVFDKNSTYIE
jgi:hypothetical protein